MPIEERKFRVVCRDDAGRILRSWSSYDESRAYQLAADLRKNNRSQIYEVEPVQIKVQDVGNVL